MAVGDITYTNPGGAENVKGFASGSLVVDADAAANIYCGFQPSRVELILADAGGGADAVLIYHNSMAAGTHLRIGNDGELTFPASLGVTMLSDSGGEGFTIPANQTGAADSDVIYWTAWR
ncbi:MAG: hypothetical protein FJX72_07415 [Armatimonadetes bacterium]|nr:hypothetical protein [Armatimonadota bacterium]